MNDYEKLVRDRVKGDYAAVYLDWIFKGRQGDPPKHPALGSMAAQAVRLAVEKAVALQTVSREDADGYSFEGIDAEKSKEGTTVPTSTWAHGQGRRLSDYIPQNWLTALKQSPGEFLDPKHLRIHNHGQGKEAKHVPGTSR